MNGLSQATRRPGVERQAGVFNPSFDENRRSLAGSVVTPPSSHEHQASVSSTSGVFTPSLLSGTGAGAGTGAGPGSFSSGHRPGGSFSSKHHGSINEGNAWYRKRASVIIPDGGSAHIKLFPDDGETSPLSCGIVINRSSRSSSQSSSQSSPTNPSIATPSPLRMSQMQQGVNESPTSLPSLTQQQQTERHALSPLKEETKIELDGSSSSETTTGTSVRNGAAVFEGVQPSRSVSRSPSPCISRSSSGLLNAPQLIMEPEELEEKRESERDKSSKEQEEMLDEVVVRLRPPRRDNSTNSLNRRSYLDDYR
ncbi:hypothetical protein BGZ65_006841 [Modicella reniformis]|uniref:Uncharacterized protein n=1 Tax=Modicella reniformis TaxID=1440133 RepID=A0A9P6IJN2_9FUNG|nr:hypothetical protein BGZ65_006841 [Modicella reniformis]